MKTIVPYLNLKEYFLSGCKSESDLQVGVEWEKIAIFKDTGKAIPYHGPRSVKAIFEILCKDYGWTPVLSESKEPIALKKDSASITLEPGGQIELSGQKAFSLSENSSELYSHLTQIKKVSEPMDIAWLGIGAQPFSALDEIEWVPKDRYNVMRENLKSHGAMTYSMMKETASVQVSLDYTSEKDAVEKLRLAMGLTPILTALFANSPIDRGEISPYLSRRSQIWAETDSERTGIIWKVFDESFDFDQYVQYALQVPMLFIQREGKWVQIARISFEEFLTRGWNGFRAEAQDWDLHLTSIFTEARLKKYLEIRSIDCQTASVGLSAVAFLKGIFYNAVSRKGAWDLIKGWSIEERQELQKQVLTQALNAKYKNVTLLELAKTLVGLSEQGLTEKEKSYLDPLKILLKEGICPAQRLLRCYQNANGHESQIKQILRCASI